MELWLLNRKAQIWLIDFIVGMMIFIIGIVLASRFIINASNTSEFAEVRITAQTMSDYLLSEGSPNNWTNDTVIKIGLTTGNRLNISKLNQFYNMTYSDTLEGLASPYDYIVYFQNNNSIINFSGVCGYGAFNITNCTIDVSNLKYDNLVRIERLIVNNDSIAEMVLYVWD